MPKPRLLFITSPESGQANVHIAVIGSLQAKHGDNVEIHLASYRGLTHRTPQGVTFHPVVGKGIIEALHNEEGKLSEATFARVCTKPGFWGTIDSTRSFFTVLHPETPAQYVETARDVERIIQEVNPDFVVLDSLASAARDAVQRLGKKYLVLIPNTFKEAAIRQQGKGMFKLPAFCSAFPYPLPWHLVVPNIVLTLYAATYVLKLDQRHKLHNEARHAVGYQGPVPVYAPKGAFTTLCMSTPEAEFPAIIPPWLICCGPILLPTLPLYEVDPELDQWVQARPTVLIVLGTHFVMPEQYGKEMLASLRVLLDVRKDVQVLWKVRKASDYTLEGVDEPGDRLRIVEWLEADPVSVLKSGNGVCFVNHGGSNSYHEGLAAGVPQIVMPAWLDCYDFASRVGYLGNGVWGNSKTAPWCAEKEFSKALLDVVGRAPDAPGAVKFRTRAKELGNLVTRNGTRIGRDVAAEHIWEEMQEARAEQKEASLV